MSARVLGIDIGSQGAVALLSVSAALLADIVVNMKAATAYVEFVSARPGEGAVGAFAFGGVPLSFLTPAHWKRLVVIAPGKEGAKDAARSEAIRRWAAHATLFARVRDDGRAEAGLMRKGVAP